MLVLPLFTLLGVVITSVAQAEVSPDGVSPSAANYSASLDSAANLDQSRITHPIGYGVSEQMRAANTFWLRPLNEAPGNVSLRVGYAWAGLAYDLDSGETKFSAASVGSQETKNYAFIGVNIGL